MRAFSAFSLERRLASERGCSLRSGVSPMSAGRTRSGSIPACCSNSIRRGEPDARTSLWVLPMAGRRLLEAIGDSALGQIIGRRLDQDLVAGPNPGAVLAHAASSMGDDFVLVFEFDAKHRIGQKFRDHARKLEDFFLRHSLPSVLMNPAAGRKLGGTYIIILAL